MQKNHHLAKSIADVSWNQFITITESRAEEAGSRVILVNHVSAMFQMWHDRQKDAF
ncbi:MAG: hypothetical protein WBH88_06525 [Candidatus Methanoculleus thermohydrogenotrophicum]|jgi:IS605 OrfB family transposase|nr:hypothetical protein [Candidatus Methanoculleus thermohydrogenotrophicum]HPZ38748.1 hypothetical protein [Candidatus Methanoculleus thermohydrogenotrophicum]